MSTRPLKRKGPVAHALSAFVERPPSVRYALRLIALLTIATTFIAGTLGYIFDRQDFHSFGDALWWALQTVTTVGYGDVVPTNTVGRLIGGVILLYAVGFLSIVSAAITTSFVERARRDREEHEGGQQELRAIVGTLDDIVARLQRLEDRAFERGSWGPPSA